MTDTTTRPTLTSHPTVDSRVGTATIEIAEDGGSYTAVRLFGAPPDRIFRAFTDPDDLRQWFPAGAPEGSVLITCESDPTEGGTYFYVMEIPEYGRMAWHGNYTGVSRPDRIDAEEWFVMGEQEPDGPPSVQTLVFDPVDGGGTLMTMTVTLGEPEDPEVLIEQTAGGLGSSLDAMDALTS
ncbi:SRPBCC domain-containing protein [Euzebya tangerina]|uniref:SRPBCC domain-containing protein n=1 Tax=Euzebya tangerina TaxID=591198 RepID=UPI000E31B2FB|nr:SRPBCC domain-containing protein [Euzebya tangerina]